MGIAPFRVGIPALVLLFAFPLPLPAGTEPVIQFHPAKGKTSAVFEVEGIEPAVLARLAKANLKREQWTALFAVRVRKEKETGGPGLAFLGTYLVTDKVLRFEPRFPLVPGVRYEAVFDPSRLPGRDGLSRKSLRAAFMLPRSSTTPTTVVLQVYPTSDKLPENLLKFYIHFSAPMSQGDVYRHIKLLNSAGKAVERPFLELQEELWDGAGRRFTLFIDPGRIKRGLKPREDLGPVLEKGKTYTLVIDRQWRDAADNPLKVVHRKTFKVLPPVDRAPGPATWKLQPPPAGTRKPLTVRFPRPMDNALLHRVLWINDTQGREVAGTIEVSGHERRWHFRPETAWKAGRYSLVAEATLEDLAGNNLERPFEIDVFHPIPRQVKVKAVRVSFEVFP